MNQQPIRILHVVTQMEREGLQTMLMNYYRKMDRDRIQFDFLTHRSEPGAYDEEIRGMGGHVFCLSPISLKNMPTYPGALRLFFRQHPEYRIMHSHIDALSALPLCGAKQAEIPVRIAHSHNNQFDRDAKYPVRMIAKRLIPHYATHLFACSQEAGRFMFGTAAKQLTVLPNAIDTQRFTYSQTIRNEKRTELGLENSFIVGHVGRFAPQKNHDKLLSIFSEVVCRRADAVLLLLGTGELQEEIRHKVQHMGLTEQVRFLDSRPDVPQLMQAMDVFVLPSRYEGLGIVLVEAQATGLPCFASAQVVSAEAKVSELLEFIPLQETDAQWAKHIVSCPQCVRRARTEDVEAAGYDINRATKWLEQFYLRLSQAGEYA